MKTFTKTLLAIFTTFILTNCSSDDNTEIQELPKFTVEYTFEGSYGSDAILTFSNFSNNNLLEEFNYEDLSEANFIVNKELIIDSTSIISGQIKIHDLDFGIRGNGTIKILNSNNVIVSIVEEQYLNTDTPSGTSYMTLNYNTVTGETTLEGN
jgi:hypothetical protein